MKWLHRTSIVLGVATALASLAALTLDKSVGYRIGPSNYARYLWAERLVISALIIAVPALLCGLAARKPWFPVALPFLGLIPLLLMSFVHSGPNLEAWCYNNLRWIEGAKDKLAEARGLTNDSPVTAADIYRLMPDAHEPHCAMHGTYIINSIGTDARCTVHGSIAEMQAAWQRTIRSQPNGTAR